MVCHRRAGKTVGIINDTIRKAMTAPRENSRYGICAPFYAQVKDVGWQYLKRFSAPIPGIKTNESELYIDYPNGSRIRLYGLDNYDRLRGGYFDGIVLDEYGDSDPRAWSEVIRPALADRQGWATFIGTPKGQNHFCDIWEAAQGDTQWFSLMLRASESGLIDAEELADAKAQMTDEQYQQEFECSFSAGIVGAYYSREIGQIEATGRRRDISFDPIVPVYTAWDLGMSDSTAIWMAQLVGSEVRLIDYIESSGRGLDWYVNELKSRPYTWADHFLPHDAAVRELGSGRSRIETLQSLGLGSARVMPAHEVADGFNATRLMLPRCYFDRDKTELGFVALRNYKRQWDEKRKVFHERPYHDWSSHAADAFRLLAMSIPAAKPLNSDPGRYSRSRRSGSNRSWLTA